MAEPLAFNDLDRVIETWQRREHKCVHNTRDPASLSAKATGQDRKRPIQGGQGRNFSSLSISDEFALEPVLTDDASEGSEIVELVVGPALALAESTFYASLRQITLSVLIQGASLHEGQLVA